MEESTELLEDLRRLWGALGPAADTTVHQAALAALLTGPAAVHSDSIAKACQCPPLACLPLTPGPNGFLFAYGAVPQ